MVHPGTQDRPCGERDEPTVIATAALAKGQAHFGDPCIHCGVSLEDMKVGPCEGDPAKAKVVAYAKLGTRWDGVERYRYRLSTNEVRECHSHVSNRLPYYHFGRSDNLVQPPRYDRRLLEAAQ